LDFLRISLRLVAQENQQRESSDFTKIMARKRLCRKVSQREKEQVFGCQHSFVEIRMQLLTILNTLTKENEMKIITSHDYPPIPVRHLDWSAYLDGQEETGPYGHGATEQEAIDNLKEQLE
jgi:hypothetical protein